MNDNLTHVRHSPESELIDALARSDVDEFAGELCPMEETLKRFFLGSIDERERQDRILRHLASCPKCSRTLASFRRRQMRFRRTMAVLAAAFVFAVMLLVWRWPNGWFRTQPEVAVVDLSAERTRGVEMPAIAISHSATNILIILPITNQPGQYEITLSLVQDQTAIATTSGSARYQTHHLELWAPLRLQKVPSGRYSLGIRRENSSWEYYPIMVK